MRKTLRLLPSVVLAGAILAGPAALASGTATSSGSGTSSTSSATPRSARGADSTSRENIRTVRKFIQAVNANDVDRVMSFYAKNAVLYDPPRCKPCRGTKAIRKVEMQDAADHFHVNLSNVKASGDTVTANFKVKSDSLRGARVRRVIGTVEFKVRDGKITSLRPTPDMSDAQTKKAFSG